MFEKIFIKRRRRLVTNHIEENNLIEPDKNKLLKGEIILTHCRGHDTILIFFLVWRLSQLAYTFTFEKLRL